MARAWWRAAAACALVLAGGYATQIVAAPDGPAQGPPLAFGDHAVYAVSVRSLETGQEQPATVHRLTVDLGAAATIASPSGEPRLATPLRFSFGGAGGAGPWESAWTFWIGGEGQAVATSVHGTAWRGAGGPLLDEPVPTTQSSQAIAWQDLRWDAPPLPCGFAVKGQAEGGPGCLVRHDNASTAWPTYVEASLSFLLGSPGDGPLRHVLRLQDAGRVVDPQPASVVAALPQLRSTAREPLGPSDAGAAPGGFPLPQAIAALREAPTDAAARDLWARQPDAYVAYARLYTANDVSGALARVWHLVVAAAGERLERAVVLEPPLVPGLALAPSVRRIDELGFQVAPAPAVVPPPGLAPDQLPGLADLGLAFAAATGREPTGWGFAVHCPIRSCLDVDTTVVLLAEDLRSAQPGGARWQRSLASRDVLRADGDGAYLAAEHAAFGQPTPDLVRDVALQPTDADGGGRATFPVPPVETAVAVGLLGLLAAAVAAAWPFLKVYLPLFSRIEATRLLDHPVRRRVHDLVHEEPGIHARQVALRLGIGGNTARHHLARLVGAGYLGERRIRGYHCYFPRGGLDERLQDAVPLLKSDGAQAVLATIASQGAPSFQSLMAATGLGYATVHHHANRLWKAGLVSSERDGKARRFRLTELGRRVVAQMQPTLDALPKLPMNDLPLDGPA